MLQMNSKILNEMYSGGDGSVSHLIEARRLFRVLLP